MYFAPPFTTTAEELRPVWRTAGSHAVLRGVDPLTLRIDKARAYALPDLAAVATTARGTPLVYAGESDGARTVVVSFGAPDSNLAGAPAFPVLVGNALDWLGRVSSAGARHPGAMVLDDTVAALTNARGEDIAITHVGGRETIALLRAPGLYFARGAGARTAIPVNAGDPQISNLSRTTLGADAQRHAVSSGGMPSPWWIYCGTAAFVLALIEWWTWHRRVTV
jgi:hypothetical protein